MLVHRQIVDVYVDESEHLGLSSPTSSRHLVVGATATTESEKLARLTKRARRKLGVRGKSVHEFKRSSDWLRTQFLSGVSKSNSQIVWGSIDKRLVSGQFEDDQERLLMYLYGKVLSRMFDSIRARTLNVIFDRRTEKLFRPESLDSFVEHVLLTRHGGYFAPELRIRHIDSRKSECLQVNDFVVGAIFQMVERTNDSYYRIIGDKVLCELRLP